MNHIEWYKLKSLEQIINENPFFIKTDDFGMVQLTNDDIEWAINEEMLAMLDNEMLYPFNRFGLNDDASYTHELNWREIAKGGYDNITSPWLFHESWFKDNDIDFGITDEDFFI